MKPPVAEAPPISPEQLIALNAALSRWRQGGSFAGLPAFMRSTGLPYRVVREAVEQLDGYASQRPAAPPKVAEIPAAHQAHLEARRRGKGRRP